MDVLSSLFANTGLLGAILACLFALIYFLIKNQRTEHSEWMKLQADTNTTLRELTACIRLLTKDH